MERIRNFFRRTWNKAQDKAAEVAVRAENTLVELKEEEKGASDMVTIIVIIGIVLLLAVVFHKQLRDMFVAIGDKVVNWINNL